MLPPKIEVVGWDARARVAAVLTKELGLKPELLAHEPGIIKIKDKAVFKRVLEALQKAFDPNEARDEAGKWTAAGGTVAAHPDDPYTFRAYKGKAVAGQLTINPYAKPLEVFEIVTNPKYRGKGAATAMMRAAEAAHGTIGPSNALSDDGFKFFNHYRPEAVANDLRNHTDKLVGQVVGTKHGPATVRSVGKVGVIVTLHTPTQGGTETIVRDTDPEIQRLIHKYSPDQLRDDHGRWASGGGVEHDDLPDNIARRIWGWEDTAPQEFKDHVKAIALGIAEKEGFPANKLEVLDNPVKPSIAEGEDKDDYAGRKFTTMGTCSVQTGEVKLYPAAILAQPGWGIQPSLKIGETVRRRPMAKSIESIVSHEIQHQKTNLWLRNSSEESQAFDKEIAALTPGQDNVLNRDSLVPGVKMEDGRLSAQWAAKYPVLAQRISLVEVPFKELSTKDGVTPYSKSFWLHRKMALVGQKGVPSQRTTISETLSELAATKADSGKLKGPFVWKRLYNTIDEHWHKTAPEKRFPTIAKAGFNPDEPRDHGQWTTGGTSISRDDPEVTGGGSGFVQATPEAFVAARDRSTREGFLSSAAPAALQGHLLLLNPAGTIGVSIDKDGDLQNLFNNGGPKGGASYALVDAISKGGRTLDCYDGHLNDRYAQFGFVETGRMKFNPAYAHGWDTEKFDMPDVVFMAWKGYLSGGPGQAIQRIAAGHDAWEAHTKATRYYESDQWDNAKSASRQEADWRGAEVYRRDGAVQKAQTDAARDKLGVGAGALDRRFVKYSPDQERGYHGRWVHEGTDAHIDAAPKDKPVIAVFGGSFNPPHAGHAQAVQDAVTYLHSRDYNVEKAIVVPTADKLLANKLADKAYPLEDRVAMTKLNMAGLPNIQVSGEPSIEAENFKGKLRRTQLADWAQREYPGRTVINVTGEDAAPGAKPPKGPNVYAGDKGTAHEGYYYLTMPREEGEHNISSTKIRNALREGTPIPEGWVKPEVVAHAHEMFAKKPHIKKAFKKAYDPNEPRDKEGEWTRSAGDQAQTAKLKAQGFHTEEPVYHETDKKFTTFKPAYGTTVWFTTDKTTLGKEGTSGAAAHGRVITAYLKWDKLAGWDEYDKYTTDQLISMGFQGARLDNDIVIFSPKNIAIAKYNPDQPRNPKGSGEVSGRWTDGGTYERKLTDKERVGEEVGVAGKKFQVHNFGGGWRYGEKDEKGKVLDWSFPHKTEAAAIAALTADIRQQDLFREAYERLSATGKLETRIKAVADAADFPMSSINIKTAPHTNMAGQADGILGQSTGGAGGRVELYPGTIEVSAKGEETVETVVAHEIFHQKFDYYLSDYNHFQEVDKLASILHPTDGVTQYSTDYWDHAGKGYKLGAKASITDLNTRMAIHETLAEMAAVKERSGKLPGAKEWQKLYKDVDKHWRDFSPYGIKGVH